MLKSLFAGVATGSVGVTPVQVAEAADRARDLAAQELMAGAAVWMTFAAILQVIVSVVALYLLYTTFRETRRAGNSADRMAEEAAKATAVAASQVDIMRRQVAIERRPWLAPVSVEAVPVVDDNFAFGFRFVFKNVGNGVAKDVQICAEIDVDDRVHREVRFQKYLTRRSLMHERGRMVFPGEEVELTSHMQFSLRQVKQVSHFHKRHGVVTGLAPHLLIVALYRDAFDADIPAYHTGAMYLVRRRGKPILEGQSYPVDELNLVRWELPGKLAAT